MAILVTGGAGYIGSVTVERLRAKGESVVVLDDLARGHRAALDAEIPFYQGNIGDRALVARITRENQIESCIHFAALAYVGESVSDPAKYFENNAANGIAFIGALVQAGVLRLVFSSTCATYGEPEEMPISEQCRQWPKNPYGWTKLLIERLLDAYDTAYHLKFVALRYFNAAGATKKCGEDHEPEPHLIPNLLATALGEQPSVPVFGNPLPDPGRHADTRLHSRHRPGGGARARARIFAGRRRVGFSEPGHGQRLLGSGSDGMRARSDGPGNRDADGAAASRRSFAADCGREQGAAGAGLGAGGFGFAHDHSHGVGMAIAASARVRKVRNAATNVVMNEVTGRSDERR